jgi:hypothetical protein
MTLPKHESEETRKASVPVQPAESPVRLRTRSRMQQLLLTAGAIGACACDGKGRDDLPIVCDPLPPPITCAQDGNMGNELHHFGGWAQSDAGLVASMSVTSDFYGAGYHSGAPLVFSADPQVTGGKLTRVVRHETSISFDCLPDAGATKVTIFVPLTCDAKPACYRMELDPRQAKEGAEVRVSVITTGC